MISQVNYFALINWMGVFFWHSLQVTFLEIKHFKKMPAEMAYYFE